MTQPTLAVYGIANCTTVKKSLAWLQANQLAYTFVNVKTQTPTLDQLTQWAEVLGEWDILINRKGTTWRQLPETTKSSIVDASSAFGLVQTHASVMKRPVVVATHLGTTQCTVGFCPDAWQPWVAAS